jgi:hypothetical protein
VKENENARADNPGLDKMDTEISHRAVDKREKSRTTVQARKVPEPWWCPAGLSKTQRRRLQKMHKNWFAFKCRVWQYSEN